MAEWDADLREMIAEQMYLLRGASHVQHLPWSRLRDVERQHAYRDADRILAFVVVREACLRTEVERERTQAEFWQNRANAMAAQAAEWQGRAFAAEAERALAVRPPPRPEMLRAFVGPMITEVPNPTAWDGVQGRDLGPPVGPPVALDVEDQRGHVSHKLVPERVASADVALIDDAVNLFRSILATQDREPFEADEGAADPQFARAGR